MLIFYTYLCLYIFSFSNNSAKTKASLALPVFSTFCVCLWGHGSYFRGSFNLKQVFKIQKSVTAPKMPRGGDGFAFDQFLLV